MPRNTARPFSHMPRTMPLSVATSGPAASALTRTFKICSFPSRSQWTVDVDHTICVVSQMGVHMASMSIGARRGGRLSELVEQLGSVRLRPLREVDRFAAEQVGHGAGDDGGVVHAAVVGLLQPVQRAGCVGGVILGRDSDMTAVNEGAELLGSDDHRRYLPIQCGGQDCGDLDGVEEVGGQEVVVAGVD